MNLKSKIRVIEGFPKEGISFKDITTLISDGKAFKEAVNIMRKNLEDRNIDYIVGPEARGFVFGSAVAYALNVGFIPVRKPGKLPGETVSYEYALEYGTDVLEICEDVLKPGDRVAIVDDLLATGGTINACAKLIESQGAEVVSMQFLMELTDLKGREKNKEYQIDSVMEYDI
ncbi:MULTISPECIES: adenine phosphoribosyltransferase [Parvimonas]|jgi:adenine phosphoribosyltransferase|uniref:Adenine phosphoribosyltransferase n=2 Tax=Parvimonas micra TaxID=33033 RepID=A0A0B4S2G9_9FIRM|nr:MULTISPECIES: adenine phosphoribosyltransferase [Parvimonas]AIZ36816.1 adenine phosphoribosyltransferase [Parvimonas micra]AXU10653.1 adenine phosphoribosyltransferase [Parvimonas micra]EDP23365.1 adenine phosphoribosyltransferase [Parvimonas micra ATCC 33270]MBF1306746.1 adenine phosphoribosyltransferase [Parvimonas micra]MCK6130593.1 adenine phosphoribosyltransferase [Parvimonas micra]